MYILKEQYEQLKQLATSRVSMSEHIRRAIDDYLQKHLKDADKKSLQI